MERLDPRPARLRHFEADFGEEARHESYDWDRHAEAMLSSSLVYIERGWYVVLLHGVRDDLSCTCGGPHREGKRVGKHPRLPEAQSGASTDPEVIRRWLAEFPDSNIGVMLGLSGLLVLDGDCAAVVRLLDERLPGTWRQRTQSGAHLLYDSGGVWGRKQTKVDYVGLDILCGENYAVMHPSRTRDGGNYECSDVTAAIHPAPLFAREVALRDGEVPPEKRSTGRRPSTVRHRSDWASAMLNDEHDLELDDSVRHGDPATYRKRHPAIRSVLLHDVQRKASEVTMITGITGSTLRTKAQESSDPERWLRDEIARAHKYIRDNPADCVLSGDSVHAANRDDAGLSSTQRKVLRGLQSEAARQGEGRFTVSLGELAIISKVSKGSAHKHARTLDKTGWINFRHKGEPGKPLATVYSLRIPRRLMGEAEKPQADGGGHAATTTHRIGGGVVGGVHAMTPLPTDVVLASDAFWWGSDLLGGSVRVLQVLSTEEPQSKKAIARRLGVTPSTVRHHLRKLGAHHLLAEDEQGGVRLHPYWQQRLNAVAAKAKVLGRADQRRTALERERTDRGQDRRQHARDNGIPMRGGLPPATFTGGPQTHVGQPLAIPLDFDEWSLWLAEEATAGRLPDH
jgi:DNA-binding MarR family transcriptional regulator